MAKLYMVLLGCRPEGRNTEQHDIFFGVANNLKELVPQMHTFWPGVALHIDAWMEIKRVGEFTISLKEQDQKNTTTDGQSLYFVNLGGYNPPDFEEYHKKILVVAKNIAEAIASSKKDNFYKEGMHLTPALRTHIDDKMDVDDVININDKLFGYEVMISRADGSSPASDVFIGYVPFSKIV